MIEFKSIPLIFVANSRRETSHFIGNQMSKNSRTSVTNTKKAEILILSFKSLLSETKLIQGVSVRNQA